MQINTVSPSKSLLSDYSEVDISYLTKELSYVNTANQHAMKRHYSNVWLKKKNKAAWEARLAELKSSINKCLLFDEDGQKYIRPGSIKYLDLKGSAITDHIKYPTPKKVPWAKQLPFELHPYQETSVNELIKVKHGNVELCTGAGKSAILLKLCRETGFRTVIVAPSTSIFNELLEKFETHLGRSHVGALGDGKRRIGKLFTICIGDSLSNIKPGTDEWEFFSTANMMCVDESHTWGAESLEGICHGILANIPYRMFFSGTQTRGDGGEKLLQSIIGETVHRLSTKDAVAGGYICPHDFTIIDLESSNPNFNSSDVLEMKRVHFLGNRNIAAFIAKLANAEAQAHGRQTLILVEELSQILALMPLLKVPYAYAHAEKNAKRFQEILDNTGMVLEKVDPAESVEKFNKNEVKVLIGTSCIATGTNIYPTHNTCNWVGGSSEIKTKQGAVGRSVRLSNQNPWADKCLNKDVAHIWDFNVYDVPVLAKHMDERISYYKDSGSAIRYIRFKPI